MAIPPAHFYGFTKPSQLAADSAPTDTVLVKEPKPPKTPPKAPLTLPKTTPISNRIIGHHAYASQVDPGDKRKMDLARETRGQYLGGMHPEKFLSTYLPKTKDLPALPDHEGVFAQVDLAKNETEMYQPFVSLFCASYSLCIATNTLSRLQLWHHSHRN